jgi:Protein of unknown function (DUF2569)
MKNENLYGVEGWLRYLVVVLTILGPLGGLGETSSELGKTDRMYPALLSLPAWSAFKTACWSIVIAASIVSIIAGIKLWKVHTPPSVGFAKMALWLTGPILAVAILYVLAPSILHVDLTADYFSSTAGSVIGSAINALIWTLYLSKSRRVKNTYGIGAAESATRGAGWASSRTKN